MKKSSRKRSPTPSIPTIDRELLLKRIADKRFAWPAEIMTAVPLDFKPPWFWNPEGEGILSMLHHHEFRKCFVAGHTLYEVSLSLDVWMETYIKVFSHPNTKDLDAPERYNLTWAILGYTDGMPQEVLNLLPLICT